jgi:hypothetical protein
MPIRNPFKHRAGGLDTTEGIPQDSTDHASPGFQKTNVVGAKPIDITEPVEYKLSGKTTFPATVLLPPSESALTFDRNQR